MHGPQSPGLLTMQPYICLPQGNPTLSRMMHLSRTLHPQELAQLCDRRSCSLQGLAVELQVSDRDEITETEIHDHVISVLTRK